MSSKKGGGPKSGGVKVPASSSSTTAQPTNAWAKPLTGAKKSTTAPSAPPGMGPPKNNNNKSTTSANSTPNASAMLMMNRDRMLSLSAGLVGQKVTLKLTTGTVVEGVYHTFTPFQSLSEDQRNQYVLKEIRVIQRGGSGSNDDNETDIVNGSTLSVPVTKVVHLHVHMQSVKLALNGNNKDSIVNTGPADTSNGFATDVQISGIGSGGSDRELVAAGSAWTTGGGGGNDGGRKFQGLGGGPQQPVNSRAAALGGPSKAAAMNSSSANASKSGGKLSGSIGQWDQFKANEELFNVNATYDENLYTTQLDTSQLDAKRVAEAERIAREIENTSTTNIHLKEERGQKIETDFDEEDLYSGVLTSDMKQRHEAVNGKTSAADTAKAGAAGMKKMNYAAALGKADAGGKAGPPGFSSSTSSSPVSGGTSDKSTQDKGKATQPTTDSSAKAAATPAAAGTETAKTSVKKKESVAGESAKKVSKADAKDKTDEKDSDKPKSGTPEEKAAETKSDDKDTGKTDETAKPKTTSKLNANAKAFTFNPSAKSFTPGGASVPAAAPPTPSIPVHPQHPPQHMVDPNMQMYGGHHMAPQYITTAQMGQPGMVPIMNPHFQGMQYPTHYRVDQHGMPQMPPQPHVLAPSNPVAPGVPPDGSATGPAAPAATPNPPAADAGKADPKRPSAVDGGVSREAENDESPVGSGENADQQTDLQQGSMPPQQQQQQQPDQSQHQMQPGGPPPQQPQHQQHQVPMPFNMPPQYYPPGGAMPGVPPRPGMQYPPQYMAVQGHQIPGQRNGAGPYGMYPNGMPVAGPNMQMRGPNGAPYYGGPNNPIVYMGQPGMVDDGGGGGVDPNFNRGGAGGRGRGRGQGRGGRGRGHGGRGGRGRGGGNYNNNNNSHSNSSSPTPSGGGNHSGRNTPQHNQPPNQGGPASKPTSVTPPPPSSDAANQNDTNQAEDGK